MSNLCSSLYLGVQWASHNGFVVEDVGASCREELGKLPATIPAKSVWGRVMEMAGAAGWKRRDETEKALWCARLGHR